MYFKLHPFDEYIIRQSYIGLKEEPSFKERKHVCSRIPELISNRDQKVGQLSTLALAMRFINVCIGAITWIWRARNYRFLNQWWRTKAILLVKLLFLRLLWTWLCPLTFVDQISLVLGAPNTGKRFGLILYLLEVTMLLEFLVDQGETFSCITFNECFFDLIWFLYHLLYF